MTACFSIARARICAAVVSIIHLLLNARSRIGRYALSSGGKDAPDLFRDHMAHRGTLAEAVIGGHSLQQGHVPIGGRVRTHFLQAHRSRFRVAIYKNYIKIIWFLNIRDISRKSRSLLYLTDGVRSIQTTLREFTIREPIEPQEESPMKQEMNVLGIDIAKRVFHAVGMDNTGNVVYRKRLSRHDLMPFIAKLSPVCIGIGLMLDSGVLHTLCRT